MAEQNFGGITLKEAITFQTQVMMGAQFGRIASKEANGDDLMIACLRMGWNDAFRHTSKNEMDGNITVLEKGEASWRKTHKAPHDDFICGNILNQKALLTAFVEFACAGSTADKIKIINKNYTQLEQLLGKYKETSGDHALCFGHFQKMFNIAIKLYVCLYLCREFVGIDDKLFRAEIIHNLQYADCPLDSIILEKLARDAQKKEYTSHKWSKYGTEAHPTENYEKAQGEIAKLDVSKGNSNLYYDFVAWKQ